MRRVGTLHCVEIPHRDIQFTTTSDGVGIAYWEIGSGLPVIVIHNMTLSHAELEWTVPSLASFYVALSEQYRVIRFDPRGNGMSDKEPPDRDVSESGTRLGVSIEEAGLDISAVAAACGVERFALLAVMSQGPVAIEFAAQHPEQLIGLILCDSLAKVESSFLDGPIQAQAALSTIESGAGSVPITMFERLAPRDELEQWSALERINREEHENLTSNVEAMREWDVTPTLGSVRTPTLILASRNPEMDFLVEARKMAAGIPNSQLRIVDGMFAPYVADRPAVLDAISNLLGIDDGPDRNGIPSGFRTVVFTDVVGSTKYVERMGDELGRAAIRAVEQLVVENSAKQGGTVVKHLGDGSLISFDSNSSALAFAIDLQRQIVSEPLQIRIGMAAGEPIQEDGDIHGAVVTQASRVAALGSAGEVLVADSVRQLALGKGYTFEPVGEISLKGFNEPTSVWRVGD